MGWGLLEYWHGMNRIKSTVTKVSSVKNKRSKAKVSNHLIQALLLNRMDDIKATSKMV